MEIRPAFQFELMENGEQERQMRQFAGCVRFVYNRALEIQQKNYAAGGKYISYEEMANQLPLWKIELPWLKDAPSQVLQQALKNLDRAFQNYFDDLEKLKRGEINPEDVRKPTFKKKFRRDSFRYPQGFKLEQGNNRIFLPKLGWIRYRNSKKFQGQVRFITVFGKADKWFVSIQTLREIERPAPPQGEPVGVDMGVKQFATLSNGTVIQPLNSFRRHEEDLKEAQQELSRKVKFSENWKKAKAKIASIHTDIANARKDFLHKSSTVISKNHAIVAVEQLPVKDMSASASGTMEEPGNNVAQKSGLNKSILDQGWGKYLRMLEYKSGWFGGQYVAVPAPYTSQTCSSCGHVSRDNRKTQSEFKCMFCGFSLNADLNAARNILRAGLARIASLFGVSGRQQEPSERAA